MASENKRVGVFNWIGTLFLYAIPGVNIIALILMLIFAKAPSKRSFAAGALIFMMLMALVVVAAFLFLPDQLLQLADIIRSTGTAA